MKKQTLKAVTMLVSIVALAFMTAVVSNAQSGNHSLRAKVPFDFIVGDRALSAGEYEVRQVSGAASEMIQVRCLDSSSQKAIRLTNTTQASAPAKRAMLKFNRYGNTYYLAQVWTAGSAEGREMLKSKAERAAQDGLEQLASRGGENAPKPETVTIFAELQ